MTKELVKSREEIENPSIEEILASIRGIINDDMAEINSTNSKDQETAVAATVPVPEDLLELTEVVENQDKIAAAGDKPEELSPENPEETLKDQPITETESSDGDHVPQTNIENSNPTSSETQYEENKIDHHNRLSDVIEENHIEHKVDLGSLPNETRKKHSNLISDEAAAQASGAMKDLLHKTTKSYSDGLHFRSGTTMEDIVIETMKPYLTKWLDDNLPGIVKHLVQKEIQKLVPKED